MHSPPSSKEVPVGIRTHTNSFIDKVNLLRELVIRDLSSQNHFMWLVSMTKEQEKFHTTLCSSKLAIMLEMIALTPMSLDNCCYGKITMVTCCV